MDVRPVFGENSPANGFLCAIPRASRELRTRVKVLRISPSARKWGLRICQLASIPPKSRRKIFREEKRHLFRGHKRLQCYGPPSTTSHAQCVLTSTTKRKSFTWAAAFQNEASNLTVGERGNWKSSTPIGCLRPTQCRQSQPTCAMPPAQGQRSSKKGPSMIYREFMKLLPRQNKPTAQPAHEQGLQSQALPF